MHKSIKCAVVGDGFVGKSSLVQKFVNGKFDKTYIATLKDEYSAKVSTNGDVFSLNVSDIAGEVSWPYILSSENGVVQLIFFLYKYMYNVSFH